ncbi:hypothetical protein CASFOL_027391 [Castilleja foliolosa]|uniref:Uncharacterized protein n=1 Tax=Castilleja foliolosa TaxID=1961234 RepID=A0ABD3CHU9_9LAMI
MVIGNGFSYVYGMISEIKQFSVFLEVIGNGFFLDMGRNELLKKFERRNLKMEGFRPKKLPELKLDTSKAKPAFVVKKPTITQEEIDEMVRGPVDEGNGHPGPNEMVRGPVDEGNGRPGSNEMVRGPVDEGNGRPGPNEMARGPVDEGNGRPGPNWSLVIAVALIGLCAFARRAMPN